MLIGTHTCKQCGTVYAFSEIRGCFADNVSIEAKDFVCHKCSAEYERQRIMKLIKDEPVLEGSIFDELSFFTVVKLYFTLVFSPWKTTRKSLAGFKNEILAKVSK